MFKLCVYIGALALLGSVLANVDDGDIVVTEDINPLEILQEAHDKERDERGVFDMFKKKEAPAVATAQASSSLTNAGYGYKSSAYSASSSSSSSSSYGGYGSSYASSSYGLKSGGAGGYGANVGLDVAGYGAGLNLNLAGGNSGYGSSYSAANTGYGGNTGYSSANTGYGSANTGYGSSNYGIKTQQTHNNFLQYERRSQLPVYGACLAYSLPNNVQHTCRAEQCEVSCPPLYTFPNGKTSLKMVCIGDAWIIRDSEYVSVPPCQATCNPPCQNNGICVEAGMCKCPDNFSGPLCQNKRSVCTTKVPVPKNSKVSCTNGICNAECFRGFQFPDGSTITNIECQDDKWIHKKSGLTKPPDCGPICDPPCANGGRCISFNVCQCAKNYRGDHCQHGISACNVTKTNFNGNYKCAYDNDVAKCTFLCPEVPGLKVEGRLDIEYKCKYEEGVFFPSPLPKCIYPPGYTIRQGSRTSHYTGSQAYTKTGSSSSYGYQYMSEREKIFAIIARYKEYDSKSEWWSSEETHVTPSSYSLYESEDINVMIDRTPKAAFCTSWGGINMKTFDGLVFKAPLSCSHTLITDKVDATFDITLKGCPFGSGYGCSHTIIVYWQSVLYTFKNLNGTVVLETPTKKLPIPVQVMGMKVVPVAQQIQIDLESIGLKIDWDRHQYVGVHASPALWSRVGGLCGSLDGDYKNDIMTKTGKIVQTVKSFTDSWRVEDNSELCVMENSAEVQFDSKNCDPNKRKQAISVCERLLTNEKLGDCIKAFNFEALIRTCVDDYCNCANQAHPETCNCDALSMLAKECSFKGVKLEHGWRNLEICPISCGFGRVYLPCGPDVEPTCESSVTPTKGKCNEGCFCPEGTVQYKDVCITPELCPCSMRDREFKPDTEIRKHCNTCTCKSGQWKCTDKKCGARCGAIGDPHYQTFDGRRFDFMGKCSYYLLKTSNLSVEAENVACSGAISENLNFAAAENPSCTKSVTVKFVQKNGVATSIKLDQGLAAQINGKELTKFPKILGSGEVLIRRASSSFITVEFPDGIRIWWDGVSRVYIDAPPSYRDQTSGLCGTFNSNTMDDFLTPEGDIETAVEPFADKWRTKDTCDFLTETGITPHPCTANPAKRAEAEKHCNWIMDDIFQDCHWSVDTEQYYQDCLYDVCACKDDPAKCFCPILSSYGTECMRQGIKTGWRMAVKECAVKCPLGQIYDECGDNCALTCEDLPTKDTCAKECVEGCRCPHGEYLNEQNECVPQSKCHCSYDGMTFRPGYKEVRPGPKFLDLCTCINGLWECEEAEPGDDKNYPPSSELRAECASRPYAEFTKCVAKEPQTCKNMHVYKADMDECVPGCQCMEGYVYDTALKMCVLPEKCSCHHGGKSYNDGEKIREDCNTCVCQAGNWKCSSNGCESTCSVWGDSHFTTFDHHDFDFQGACDYVLSKGVANNGDGFSITIQNVLCGTMGVTCSKSVEISLTGSVQDTLILAGDASYLDDPSKSIMNKIRDTVNTKAHGAFHVYKAGVFVVVEVLPLHLQIKWDEGTRVYVKLGNEWKNKVSGLCGNYNDNAMDDMKTPTQALETSALTFGHSWKVQQYCAMPTVPIDACKEHPERETWAQLKCGILKSNHFKDCHAEVPVEKYLKRCIFDTCACDQGGDCECLCTAVAAYAHACSQKGIQIRWRTPHFCPMQCDPHCSEYKSCTSACPVETCDNFLQLGGEQMCKAENCIEGCQIKTCEEGLIYLNDTYKECVPKSECKPVCMIKDGITYYEGDITYQDECSTCRCSKKKEICNGVKCAEELITPNPVIDGTTLKPLKTEEQTKCVKGWTRWFDDDPYASNNVIRLDDSEKLPRYDRMESIYGTCKKEFMKKIECRVVNTHESSEFMDENVFCNLQNGLNCVGNCHDYEIRVFCECDAVAETTPKPTEKPEIGLACDSVISEYKEFPGDCHKFLHCQPKVDGSWHYVEKTCGDSMMFNPIMFVCDHIATVQELKPICGKKDDSGVLGLLCPPNTVWSDCANQCERTCHYYGQILLRRGLCKEGEHCKGGCVPSKRTECPPGRFWRDENNCVEADACPCMDSSEKYVQPHMPFVGEWEVCQCLDNAYTCLPNKLEDNRPQPPPRVNSLDPFDVFPTTISPPKKCNPENMIPVIEGEVPLPDTIFKANSSLGPNYVPSKARLLETSKENAGAWSPMINDQNQYLEITLPEPEPLFGVIMAGSPDFDNYVTLFKIYYSNDGEAYHALNDETDKPQLFNGPHDSRTPAKTLFKIPIEAKTLKIYPLKWHGSIAIRVELLGCGHIETTTVKPKITPITEHPIHLIDDIQCTDKMGVDNNEMSPNQVKASTIWQLPKPAKKPQLLDLLKLSSPVGWKPALNTPNEYIEFDFLEPRNVSGFITKGGPDGWVTGYKIMYSKNKLIWNKVLGNDGQPRIFAGNHDKDTEHATYFKTPIMTQYIKLVPAKYENNINMRVEPVGCFKKYPIVKQNIAVQEVIKTSKCFVCEGILDSSLTDGNCKCKDNLFWDGNKCVQSNLCPCVENYITYPIGSTFENELCEECTCVLGGHSSCKPKKCPPCKEPDQRPIVGTGCYCKCEPCPKHQRLCPSSGDCIAEVLWCNGIKDCADDEDKTCSNVILVNNKPNITSTESEIISCPVPECPPKMKMKITEKKQRKMSSMFSSTFTKKVTVNRGEDGRLTRTKVITSSEEFLGKPTEELDMVHEDDCAEFTCVPLKEVVVSRNETRSCPPPACPDKYMVELDMSSVKPGDCPPYACILKPNKDDFCEISGKVFRTFDGTEFNYETCSHILARDLLNSSWVISVHLECTDATRKVCRKTITIKDAERGATLTILPKKRLNFNGFEYTVPQLINSPICKASFVVSQVGDTVMVVSPENGFWVRYDDIGYIRIGVSSKFIKTVDGLCGYYDGNASNDKRTPDGVQMSNTAKFGDSWFDNKTPKDQCYPQTCPLKLRTQALTLCNSIKFDEFINCKKSVSYKPFATKCVETTCECLKVHNGDVKKCRCNLMEDYVKQCLTVNPHVKLDTWRAKHQCEIACPAPFVHSDCYKRRCEPSCDTLNTDDCPVLGDACFAGCYCPEGTVRKGETCVPISDCKDCVCDTIGAKKYFTYDRNSFTFNGNCTYLLSRDIVLPGVHTFQVYVTMEDCRKMGKLSAPEHSSCAKSLHILNGDHVIHIQRDPKKAKALQVLVDGFLVKKLPYKDTWINLKDVPGKELVLSLTEAHVELKASLEDLIFSLGVPSIKYGSKMEGLCGDCDGNPDNDLLPNPAKKKGRKPSKDLVDVINSWKAEEPKLGLELDECLSEVQVTEECLPLPPEKDPCMLMFDESIFGKCNMIVDPLPYISTCQQDLCKPGNDQKGSCESLSAYAKECAKQGICLDWRSPGLCPYDCPADMHYESCGCSKSCDSLQQLNEFQAVNINTNTMVNTVTSEELCAPSERYEGCFCPPNKVLENGKCISEEMCVKCEDPDHTPGERWKKDKCTECLCDKQGKTQCMERKCLVEENICAEGFVQQKKYDPEDQCCPRYTCVQEPPQALRKDCLEPLMPICGPGQFKKIKTGSDGCPQYICECKPKEECEPLTPPVALKPGEKLVKEEAGCCPTQKIVCDEKECPAKPEFCIEEFYEVYTKQEPNDCCPIYYCDPPKQVCIVPGGPNGKYTKAITDTWTDPNDSCKILQCTFGPHDSAQVVTNTVTCDTKCGPGFEYKRKDLSKCCGECVQTQCVLDGKLYEANEQWPSAVDNCTTFACVKKGESLIVSSMKETCPDVSDCPEHLLMPQEDSCCKLCKEEPHKEDLTNCLPVSLAETETRNLVKVLKPGQGFCINESPIQGFTECMGSCNSGSKYNKETFGQDKICQCCTIKSYKKISVQLTCEDGVKISKELEIPAACGCQPCSDSAEYQTSGNGFDLRVQPLPLAKMIEMKRRPMQCDPHCSEYKSCTSACPVETCDNFLQLGGEQMCKAENCIEGCQIKTCEEGLIYLNDTYKECVPKSECKPVCMIKDGITYYEGDITYQDECSTCRCSKKKEICNGVKCAEELITPNPVIDGTTLKPLKTEEQTKCVKGWTRWFDDDPYASNNVIRLDDSEKLPRYDRMESIYGTCKKEFMKKIECRVVNTHESSEFMDENVFCNLQNGLNCVGNCHDYEIRVFCECDAVAETTPKPTEKPEIGLACDSVISEYKEFPGDCHKFLHCQPKVDGSWHYVEKTCGDSMMFNPIMFVCDHIATVQELKPICGKKDDSGVLGLLCPPNTVWSDCANQCERTCHYYGQILLRRGLCKEGEHCKGGCVPSKRTECPPGRFWRDENNCVEADACPCMDSSEKYVQPHMPFVGEWEVCQCLDNAYTCLPNKLEDNRPQPPPRVNSLDPFDVFPTTISPPKKCNPENMIPVIEGEVPLPDTIFKANSSLGPNYVPSKARLLETSKENAGAWSPMINDQNQYLEITLPEPEPLFGVIMAGSPDFDNYVTLFKIYYSNDGEAYHALNDETDKPQLFNGPHDSRTPAKTLFKIPIEAKTLKIYPLKWHGSIAIRVELLGCGHIETTTVKPKITPITEHPIHLIDDIQCTDKMGVDNNEMSPNQVKASTIWQLPKPAKKPQLLDLLKLSSPVGWKPALNTPNEYIEFDFLEPRNVSGFITKGGPDGWVTGYKIMYSKNKLIWNKVLGNDGQPRIFAGNHDKDTEHATYFKTPIMTQYIKLVPAKYENNINMRVEPVGCFKKYPIVKQNIAVQEVIKTSKCFVCEGILDSSLTDGNCKCKDNLFWDGNKCVQSNLCPCVENYITYPIGSTFENELCEECTCVLGGHSSCKPKKCPPCKEPDQRPIVGTGCYCKCEPCPKHQRLCPSSGDCIAEVLWCNGIKDCADDEDKTCSNVILVNNKPNITSTESEIISCPVPECPPKMKMKITEKKQRKMSSMFSSTFTKKVTVNRGEDGRLTRTKVITSSEEFLGKPTEELDMVHEDDCAEFTCVPLKEVVVSRNETRSCPPPACPDKYMVELDMSSVKPGDCPPYACILKPNKDDFCEISGKVFRTFDGTEFNYETCSHILARDLLNSSWVISVHLECTDATRKVCRKTITIKDAERGATLTILPKKRLNFNGFEYTVPQLINSPICKASFVVSQVGDTVMVVSPENGFWVRYDDIGYIRIGVSSKFIKTVDGLCGYYDGNASNDKRTPDGVQMSNTAKFGDSWFDNKTPKDQCYPQTCPLKLRTQALTLCNSIKFDEFINCKKSVSYKPFATKCVETTCECLKVHNGDVKKCRCNLMEDYVKQCLTVNPHVKLDTWRAKHQCEIACPAPFVHSDCYKRRCEPSCDTLNTDDCPVLGDACFAGCYCPEGTVRKGETCVPISDCKDCVCDTIGAKKYFTYDRNSFTFNGNCTYLLSRDIVLPGVHTFQVYVTMEDCRKMGKLSAPEHSSCAKSLHILNGDHVIHIQRDPKKAKALQVLVDGFLVKKLPYKDTWINLKDVPGKELVLSLTEAHVELKASLEDLIFSLGVPSIKYGSKMEGLCGDCDGNPDNDLLPNPAKKKGRKPSKDLVDVINSWKAEEPKLGLELDECLSEVQVTEECLPLPPEKDPCMLMFDESIFGKCNMIVDPLPYISTCQQDLCKPGNDQKGSCESLSAYAKECAKQGICLDWRSPGLCPYDCPADMHYESCGCSKSCDSLQQLNEFQAVNINTNTMVNTVTSEELCAPSERYEGCFCPPNKVLENGKCISEEMCVKCEDPDHTPGERWKKDKCTECLCDKQGKTQCMERKCLVEENICAEGFVQQKKYDPEDQCCPRYTCVQEPPQALRKDCLEPLMPICGPGQFKKIKTGSDGCPQYICECKPKEECEPLTPPVALKPGEKLVKEEAGCCPTQKIVCDEKECPAKPEFCIEEFYEVYTKQEPNDCCPIYYCDPPKQVCIVPGGPNGKYTKAITDTWTDPNDSCKILQCTFGPHDSAQVVTNTVTCDTKCGPGFEYKRKDLSKCCGECVQTQCVLDGKLYEANEQWPSAVDNCTTFACVKKGESLIVSSMKETCPDVSDCPEHLLMPQEDSCCKLCKEEPHKEDLTNCLPVSLAETETRNLVKVLKPGQGFCINESPIQGFTECMGSCNSGSKYNKETFGQDKICQCCTIKSYKKISVQLTCEDGVKISKELEIPAACGCQPCSDSAEYQTSGNGFDLRVQPLPLAKMIEMKRR
uniref:Hemocytin n=1 Tax=Stomoxys calcitrans TaxID=35570 RepID=A0A1I8Q8K8_STOCA